MKYKACLISLAVFAALVFGNVSVFSQSSGNSGKCKSRTVHEEKIVKGVKNTVIDSEEKYDLNGNVVDEIQYKDGKVDKHFVYEYDSNNNKIKESELDGAGKTKKISEFKYVNGLRTEKYTYDENKKLTSKKTYSYYY